MQERPVPPVRQQEPLEQPADATRAAFPVSSGVAGIILAGGRSRRMGRDKALLSLPGADTRPFVTRLADLLTPICAEVLLVARDPASGQQYASLAPQPGWRLVYDQVPDEGPLMGLASGLRATICSHALVVAVDLPCVQSALLAWLAAFPLTDELLIPLIASVPQVLLARYPRAILPVIEICLNEGRRDPRALLERAPVRFLTEEQVYAVDPDLRSFLNVNTPGDLARMRM